MTRPTHHPRRHPYPFRRFSTVHWTDRPTDRQTNRWFAGKFYRERRGLIKSFIADIPMKQSLSAIFASDTIKTVSRKLDKGHPLSFSDSIKPL